MAGLDLPARVGRNDAQNARRRRRRQLPCLCFAAEGQPCFVHAGIIAAVQHRKRAAFRQRHCVCRRGLRPDGDADRIGIRRFADDALPIVLPVGDGEARPVSSAGRVQSKRQRPARSVLENERDEAVDLSGAVPVYAGELAAGRGAGCERGQHCPERMDLRRDHQGEENWRNLL